jgi:hypothetical protein
LGYTFGDFFTNSSDRPATYVECCYKVEKNIFVFRNAQGYVLVLTQVFVIVGLAPAKKPSQKVFPRLFDQCDRMRLWENGPNFSPTHLLSN